MADAETRMSKNKDVPSFSRRGFIGASATSAALPLLAEAASRSAHASPVKLPNSPLAPVTLHINGQRHDLALDPRTTLLDALREHVGLTGSKKGCDHGQCGACTVHMDGRGINACLILALTAQGAPDHDDRRARRTERGSASAATGLHRPRRLSVRVLHVGPDHVGGRLHRQRPCGIGRPPSVSS